MFGLSEYLLSSINSFESTRYIALAEVTDMESNIIVSYILVNTSSDHGSSIGLNLINQAKLRYYSGNTNAKIRTSGTLLPFSFAQESSKENIKGFGIPITTVLAFAFIPAYFVTFLVKERELGVKHQQLISGVSLPAFWIATFVWDMITYIIPCIVGILLMYIFNFKAFKEHMAAVIVLFIMYGITIAPSTYFVSYFFKNHSAAQNTVLFVNIINMLFIVLTFVTKQISSTCRFADGIEYIYCFILNIVGFL